MKTYPDIFHRSLTHRLLLALLVAGLVGVMRPAPGAAADREHQQIMADIRMLQEQAQQLQAVLGGLTEVLKTVTAKLDEQAAVTRKAFADDKLTITNVSGDIRIVREKVDETNVRLSSLAQELEALRQAIPPPAPAPMPSDLVDPLADPAAPPAAAAPAAPLAPGMSPQRLYDTAWADYSSGQWSLAIQGFETFLRYFPKSDLASRAQFYIGDTNYSDAKYAEAIAAYNRVITNYPGGDTVPQAYYKRGLAYERLGQIEEARQSFDIVTKQYPDSDAGRLSRQALDRLNRSAR